MKNSYRVWLHGSSMSASYDGYVDVMAADEFDAADTAKHQLTRRGGTFQDWGPSMFRVEKVEPIFN